MKKMKTLLAAVGIAVLASQTAFAAGEKWDPNYKAPRMPDGTPSFQGFWTNASLTALERGPEYPNLVIPEAVAQAIATGTKSSMDADKQKVDVNRPAFEAGGAGVGGYNTFWMDFGTQVARINGEYRSSWIVEPEDGKIPYSENGKKLMGEYRQMFGKANNPEERAAGERCTVGFGSTGGAPMLNVLYNNNYQIVQEPETVAIRVEMNHNTRLVRINGEHRPDNMLGWLGDTVGHWEGDTLVMHTKNFEPGNYYRGAIRHRFVLTKDAEVEERLTRVSDDELFYEFTVTDPNVFEKPWKAESVFVASHDKIYEYACHEGNYALPGILRGARLEEEKAAKGGSK